MQVCSCGSNLLGFMWWPRLSHQADLGSKAPGSGILKQTWYCIVVQVVDEVTDPRLMSSPQLVCSQRGQRGACSPRTNAITITWRAEGQLGLRKTEWSLVRGRNGTGQRQQNSGTQMTTSLLSAWVSSGFPTSVYSSWEYAHLSSPPCNQHGFTCSSPCWVGVSLQPLILWQPPQLPAGELPSCLGLRPLQTSSLQPSPCTWTWAQDREDAR